MNANQNSDSAAAVPKGRRVPLEEVLEQRDRLRRRSLVVVFSLLLLPIAAAIWLFTTGGQAKPLPEANIDELQKSVAKVNEAVVQQNRAREADRAESRASVRETTESLKTVQESVARVDQANSAQAKEHAQARLDSAAGLQRSAELAAKLDDVERKSAQTTNQLQATAVDLKRLDSVLRDVQQMSANDKQATSELRERQSAIMNQLQAMQESNRQVAARSSELERRFKGIESDLAQIKASVRANVVRPPK
jgi:uncharacterized phage infection (PIP) family protein YhgE